MPPAPLRVGLYGGSFDPVHHGHLLLARDAVEQLGLARLIFIPAAVSPHKLDRVPGASADARLRMLAAAVAGEAGFEVDPRELARAGPSYTFDTVRELRAELPPATELFYLIGEDNLASLHTWHRAAELAALVRFAVCRRRAPDGKINPGASNFPVLERWLDLSSTEIRNRVAEGRSIRYFVPQSVAAIIRAEALYRPPHPGDSHRSRIPSPRVRRRRH